MITIDATFIAFVALVLFIGLMIYLKVPAQVGKALDDQSAKIAAELKEAERLRDEARALLSSAEAQKIAAEREATTIIAHAKEQAQALVAEAKSEHTDAMARRRRQAEERIARAEEQAEADVRAAAAESAVAAAERILRERLDAQAHAQIVQDGVRDLQRKLG
ncbi:MAG: ATPase [Hyphomonadaceae bacterium]|nr:ATPase [Hyphomonadaceae bacterium]